MAVKNRRRLLLSAAAAAIALVLVAVVSLTGGSTAAAPFERSWHAPLPSAQVSPHSADLVRDFVGQYHRYYGSVGINGLPIYTASVDQKRSAVSVRPGCNNFILGTGRFIPIPPIARTSGQGDSPLVVFQPSTHTEWELWKAERSGPARWTACWGGKLTDVDQSSGIFPSPYGLAASEISYLATTITESDIASGRISHTLAVDVVDCSGPPSPPAIHTDCSSTGELPREGMIFRLSQKLAEPKGLTPFARMVFVALQRYGMVVMDHAGAVIVEAEATTDWSDEGHSGIDPITASWQGKQAYQVLSGIPWDRLQVLDPTGGLGSR